MKHDDGIVLFCQYLIIAQHKSTIVKPGIDASIQDIQPSKQNIEREYRTLEKLLDFAVRLNYNDVDKNKPYG